MAKKIGSRVQLTLVSVKKEKTELATGQVDQRPQTARKGRTIASHVILCVGLKTSSSRDGDQAVMDSLKKLAVAPCTSLYGEM